MADDLAYDDVDLEDSPSRVPPTVVLGPAAFLAIPAVGLTALGVLFATSGVDGRAMAVPYLSIGLVLAALVVGLWRRWRIAHVGAYLVGGAVALTGVGLLVAVPMIWALSTRAAKDWFGVR